MQRVPFVAAMFELMSRSQIDRYGNCLCGAPTASSSFIKNVEFCKPPTYGVFLSEFRVEPVDSLYLKIYLTASSNIAEPNAPTVGVWINSAEPKPNSNRKNLNCISNSSKKQQCGYAFKHPTHLSNSKRVKSHAIRQGRTRKIPLIRQNLA
jgi:hypothetical protein